MSVTRRAALAAFASPLVLSALRTARADGWPARPIRMVVPWAAGGSADMTARVVGERLTESLGKPVVVESIAGAGGNIGANAVARSDPDGYTFMLTTPGPVAINQFLYKRMAFDPATAFAPVAIVCSIPSVLVVSPQVQATTVAELIALLKANPGKFNYGSSGVGTTGHLAAELFKLKAGIEAQHVPYRGSAPVMQDLLTGNLQFGFPADIPLIASGQLRGLAVTSRSRMKELPDLPTMIEAGMPDFDAVAWYCVMAPAGTPEAITRRLNAEVNRIIKLPEVVARFSTFGATAEGGSVEDFTSFIMAERKKWQEVVKLSGASID